MIKKIAEIFKKNKSQCSKLNFDKRTIGNIQEAELDVFDEYSQRLPGFPLGIPVIPVELLIERNKDMIKQIILARGLAGSHNKDEVEKKIMAPIRHLAEMTHLLPASEKNHFKLVGGLFSFCLEVSLFSIRYAERRILTRATPEIRKEEESLWAHAAFLTGLFSEAITAISKISVYAEDVGIEWRPGSESLYEWLMSNELKRYHIRWSEMEDRSTIYIMAGKSIQKEQTDIFAAGEKAIYKTLYAALQDQKDHSNPLANIVDTVRYKIMERDEWSYADRYGKPLAGMHLEPWLIDAMRHLVQKKRWSPNEENGRIWHGHDGVFLVWPLAAGDMQYQLKAAECPFVPSTQEILAEIMLDAGIIERNKIGGYVYPIGVPVAESDDRKFVEALKLARYEALFAKTQHKPIEVNLEIELEEEESNSKDKESNNKGLYSQENKEDVAAQNIAVLDSEVNSAEKMDLSQDKYEESESSDKAKEKINKDVLFGKQEKGVAEKVGDLSISNEYDDDYIASYHRNEKVDYHDFPDSCARELEFNDLKNQELEEKDHKQSRSTEGMSSSNNVRQNNANGDNVDLLESLIGKTKTILTDKKQDANAQKPTYKANNSLEIDDLIGKKSDTYNTKSERSALIIDILKKLPAKYLEASPDGFTKVKTIGLRETKLDLKDCISVLKTADMLVLIDGNETGLGSTGKQQSRYFLVKTDLINGK